jgi:transcriptional regulator GlxA family with amidase domain
LGPLTRAEPCPTPPDSLDNPVSLADRLTHGGAHNASLIASACCLLSLLRARNGYSAALDVASLYIYDEVRTGSDAQPIASLGRIRQHEQRVAEAIRIMEAHIDRPLKIAAIARRVGVLTRPRDV